MDEDQRHEQRIQFQLKTEDDQHDPEKAVNAYNTLKGGLRGMQLSLTLSPPSPPRRILRHEL